MFAPPQKGTHLLSLPHQSGRPSVAQMLWGPPHRVVGYFRERPRGGVRRAARKIVKVVPFPRPLAPVTPISKGHFPHKGAPNLTQGPSGSLRAPPFSLSSPLNTRPLRPKGSPWFRQFPQNP